MTAIADPLHLKPTTRKESTLDIRKEIAERLSDLGWTTAELCRRADVDYSHTHKWLNEKKAAISTVTLDLILKAMGWDGVKWSKAWV